MIKEMNVKFYLDTEGQETKFFHSLELPFLPPIDSIYMENEHAYIVTKIRFTKTDILVTIKEYDDLDNYLEIH